MSELKYSAPMIVVVGQTASGKSALSMHLAEKFRGEIICADSRTIYRGMDIGTAKPSLNDQSRVVHHLLNIKNPDETYSALQFKNEAKDVIYAINSKHKLPIMTGGTGLYVDAVLYDYKFPEVKGRDPINPRHAHPGSSSDRTKLRPDTLVIGLNMPKEQLKTRIIQRVEEMIDSGLQSEAEGLIAKYGKDAPGLNTIGYKEWATNGNDKKVLEEIKAEIIRNTVLYAKRQDTWFKRNKSIQWIDHPSEAVDLVTTFLYKYE